MIKIACCQYQIETLPDWEHYTAKIENLVMAAKAQGATLLLMPEYAGIEAACKHHNTDKDLYDSLKLLIPKYLDLYKRLAIIHQIYIQAGTIIEKISSGKFANRAYLFSPTGTFDYQDKLQLTETEKDTNFFEAGDHQKIFETPFGKLGIAVCYDSEFPEIVRNLTQHAASIILVPSYTTTLAGYNRVFFSCRARAIENQCYVAVSYVINTVDLTDDIDETYGQAAILGPADRGFPNDGILALGTMNESMLLNSELSLENLDRVRNEGQVHNFEDSMLLPNTLANHYTRTIKLFT